MTQPAKPTTERRHDRPPTDAQRDERVRIDVDPDDVLRKLLGVEPEDTDEKAS